MKKLILMTGITGYLGGQVARRLVQNQRYRLIALVRKTSCLENIADIVDHCSICFLEEINWSEFFERHKVDGIIHCATNYGRNSVKRMDILEANLLLPLRLLELGAANGVQVFINTDTMLDKCVSDYSLSKNQFRDWLEVFSRDIYCINIALEHFFGPGDNPTKFVSYLMRQLMDDVESIDLTYGEQCRDFIYIQDVVDALDRIIESTMKNLGVKGFEEYQVGSGKSIPIRDFVVLMKNVVGNTKTKLNFGAISYRRNEAMVVNVDITKLQKLGWNPKVPLEEALRRTFHQEKGKT